MLLTHGAPNASTVAVYSVVAVDSAFVGVIAAVGVLESQLLLRFLLSCAAVGPAAVDDSGILSGAKISALLPFLLRLISLLLWTFLLILLFEPTFLLLPVYLLSCSFKKFKDLKIYF